MIFVQVVVGGITRLTGSGLSITKWEIVTGTLPPLNAAEWQEAFDLYKETPQYAKINQGMSLSSFKFIFFWEYIHRLWARLMGFVFAVPFLIFWQRKMLDKPLMRRLGIVVLLAAVVASFGWIMVASGLVNRPWVNAYKLTMHLSLAFVLYSYLWWTTLGVLQPDKKVIHNTLLKRWIKVIFVVLSIQIILGGIMSGMKAGLFYPTWPDMNGQWIPGVLTIADQWNVNNFVHYDTSPFMSALIQLLHRTTAYLLSGLIFWYFYKAIKMSTSPPFRVGIILLVTMLVIQVLLGIFTLINCVGMVPVALGVLHQAGALLLLTIVLFVIYQVVPTRN
ncbi:MAG: heme A synthase [Saprospiraceae bacterium]|nr:MAG: heme A synthase [Saprospiraceae bacterium]